jgi:hypothetical protein
MPLIIANNQSLREKESWLSLNLADQAHTCNLKTHTRFHNHISRDQAARSNNTTMITNRLQSNASISQATTISVELDFPIQIGPH